MHSKTFRATLRAVAVAFLAIAGCKPEPVATPPTAPATVQAASATSPATEPASKPAAIGYFDLLRQAYPALPATQPLAIPVSLRESAHLILSEPVHLDEQGHLWITHPQGTPAEEEIRNASVDIEHVVRDRVLFAWWVPDPRTGFAPRLVVPDANDAPQLVGPSKRLPMGPSRDYRWDRARSWVDATHQRLIVPTRQGVSVFTYVSDREPITEVHQDLTAIAAPSSPAAATAPATAAATAATRPTAQGDKPLAEPQFLFDPRGFIAWIPATPEAPGSPGAARFLDGAWLPLTPDAGWPDRILHLVPLRDGSVTQLLLKPADEGGGVTVALAAVDAPSVDKEKILGLVDQLSDADKDIRNDAYGKLTEYGAGIWPILREINLEDHGPEARSRLNRLLKSQATPMLGGMALQGDQLKLVTRLRDGGAVFYTDQGINLPDPLAVDPISHAPAWIAARPGRPVEMLTGALVFHADPKRTAFDVVQGQWILTMDDAGPQQFLGNSFRPLVRKEGREFTHVVGIDRRGRWILRKPAAETVPPGDAKTLIVDTTIPDFTPRLPVWLYANCDEAGWDKEGYPAVRLGELRVKLIADRWASLKEEDEIFTEPPDAQPDETEDTDPAAAPNASHTVSATTAPSASPSTAPSSQSVTDLGTPLLTDAAGNRYFGGVRDLTHVGPDGARTTRPLPDDAIGESPAHLILAGDHRLFLFNRPGRVLRLKPSKDPAEPFVLEETFTNNIPEESATRIWLDPVGRIIMAYDRRLAILFPQGFIPRPIRQMMDMPDDEE